MKYIDGPNGQSSGTVLAYAFIDTLSRIFRKFYRKHPSRICLEPSTSLRTLPQPLGSFGAILPKNAPETSLEFSRYLAGSLPLHSAPGYSVSKCLFDIRSDPVSHFQASQLLVFQNNLLVKSLVNVYVHVLQLALKPIKQFIGFEAIGSVQIANCLLPKCCQDAAGSIPRIIIELPNAIETGSISDTQ